MLMKADSFSEVFTRLMTDVGRRVDAADEHARLDLYRSLLSDEHWRPGVLACLALEPDAALATSVLAALLEVMMPAERELALSAAPASGAEFLATRADELAVLELVTADTIDDPTALERLVSGSDWLQRRASEQAQAAAVLSELATRGRTKKVRARAAERARQGSRP